MGHKKSQKGQVSISNYKGRIRLRWRHKGIRHSLSLHAYNKTNLSTARKVVLQIELDILNGQFDHTLEKYGGKCSLLNDGPVVQKTIVQYFEQWVKEVKQLDCDKNSDYNHLRNTLRKWGELHPRLNRTYGRSLILKEVPDEK
jgi:integrase